MDNQPLIKLENVSLSHNPGEENEVWSLKDINAEIYPEEHIIFFGPSGCGKSSLLNTIAGLERPTKGSITINGIDLTKLTRHEMIGFHQSTIGMVFQAYFLIPNLTARDNIILPQLFAGRSRAERTQKTDELMERFGITDFQNRRPAMLSGGQQQRIAIARALANDPMILLADEPAGNLDSNNTYIVLNLLSEFKNQDKKTIVHVTHDPQHLHYADRVFYMKDGKIAKIVVNPKSTVTRARELSEFEYLQQAHPYLKEQEIVAKILLNRLTTPFGVDARQRIEEAISKYVDKSITEQELLYLLDEKPIDLYKQTAHELTKNVIDLVGQMSSIRDSENDVSKKTSKEKASIVRVHLLTGHSSILSIEQVQRLEDILTKRIEGTLSGTEMQNFFDTPYKKGGVGLNRRTAINFKRDVEVILMKQG